MFFQLKSFAFGRLSTWLCTGTVDKSPGGALILLSIYPIWPFDFKFEFRTHGPETGREYRKPGDMSRTSEFRWHDEGSAYRWRVYP
jgi:hypothetical protein